MREEYWLIILVMAGATYATRVGSFLLLRLTGLPKGLERWTAQVPTGILAALVVPALLLPQGQLDVSWHNSYLVAGVAAAWVAWRTSQAVWTMATGLGVMGLLRLGGI